MGHAHLDFFINDQSLLETHGYNFLFVTEQAFHGLV
jgi:hypothetical protein